jgi:hypothetical protein
MRNTPRLKLVRSPTPDILQSDRPVNVVTSLVENNTVIVDDKIHEEIEPAPFSKNNTVEVVSHNLIND